jgi:hypothetical protein
MMSDCEHYACQQDMAINDGHCPICQAAEIDRLTHKLADARELIASDCSEQVLLDFDALVKGGEQ